MIQNICALQVRYMICLGSILITFLWPNNLYASSMALEGSMLISRHYWTGYWTSGQAQYEAHWLQEWNVLVVLRLMSARFSWYHLLYT